MRSKLPRFYCPAVRRNIGDSTPPDHCSHTNMAHWQGHSTSLLMCTEAAEDEPRPWAPAIHLDGVLGSWLCSDLAQLFPLRSFGEYTSRRKLILTLPLNKHIYNTHTHIHQTHAWPSALPCHGNRKVSPNTCARKTFKPPGISESTPSTSTFH